MTFFNRTFFQRRSRRAGFLMTVCAVPAFVGTAGAAVSSALPSGTSVSVRTVEAIDSKQTEVGQSYRCTVDAPVVVKGDQLVARGADCVLQIVETRDAGKLTGKAELKLECTAFPC